MVVSVRNVNSESRRISYLQRRHMTRSNFLGQRHCTPRPPPLYSWIPRPVLAVIAANLSSSEASALTKKPATKNSWKPLKPKLSLNNCVAANVLAGVFQYRPNQLKQFTGEALFGTAVPLIPGALLYLTL